MASETPENGVAPLENEANAPAQPGAVFPELMSVFTSGPLPHPGLLEEYKKVDPAILKQILYMAKSSCDAENEQKKAVAEQIKAESKSLLLERELERRGQWFVLVAILLLILAGTYLAVSGFTGAACTLFAVLGTSWIIQLMYRPK